MLKMNHLSSPVTVNFVITEYCNAKCLFCSVRNQENIKFEFHSLNQIKRLLDIFKCHGILRINFFGGEPFIYPYIKESIIYAKKLGFYVSTVTNGLNITRDLAQQLKGYLDVVGISVHGFKENHEKLLGINGSFEKALNAIENFSDANIPTGFNMTITAKNYNEVTPIVEYMKSEYDIRFASLNRFIPNKYLTKDINNELTPTIEQLEKTLYDIDKLQHKYPEMSLKYAIHFPHCIIKDKKLWAYIGSCGFGKNYCSVDSNGNFKTCSYSDYILGNVLNESLKDIWNSNILLNEYRTESWLPQKCILCSEKNKCMSGCKVSNGTKPFAPDILIENIEV